VSDPLLIFVEFKFEYMQDAREYAVESSSGADVRRRMRMERQDAEKACQRWPPVPLAVLRQGGNGIREIWLQKRSFQDETPGFVWSSGPWHLCVDA
jgi:hypothetical protein